MKHRDVAGITVRVDVFCNTPMVQGWFAAFTGPGHYHPTNDHTILKACRKYQAWVRSLEKQTERAKHTRASAVRLTIDKQVVAAFGQVADDTVWQQNGSRGALKLPPPKQPKKPRKKKDARPKPNL